MTLSVGRVLLLAAVALPASSATYMRGMTEAKLRPYKTHAAKQVSHLELHPDAPSRLIAQAHSHLAPTVSFSTDADSQLSAPPLPPPAHAVASKRKAAHAAAPQAPEVEAASQVEVLSDTPTKLETATPDAASGAVKHFNQKLFEVKQRRANVVQMQQALSAEVALLRESTALQKASESQHSREEANKQIKKTEQLVKDTTAMLRESRAEAVEDAKQVLQEVSETQSALDALQKEATAQLKTLASSKKSGTAETARVVPAAEEAPATEEAPAHRARVLPASSSESPADEVDDLDDSAES